MKSLPTFDYPDKSALCRVSQGFFARPESRGQKQRIPTDRTRKARDPIKRDSLSLVRAEDNLSDEGEGGEISFVIFLIKLMQEATCHRKRACVRVYVCSLLESPTPPGGHALLFGLSFSPRKLSPARLSQHHQGTAGYSPASFHACNSSATSTP